MISLEVEDYCQKCPDFEPTVTRFYSENEIYMQVVKCECKQRCNRIYEMMKGENA